MQQEQDGKGSRHAWRSLRSPTHDPAGGRERLYVRHDWGQCRTGTTPGGNVAQARKSRTHRARCLDVPRSPPVTCQTLTNVHGFSAHWLHARSLELEGSRSTTRDGPGASGAFVLEPTADGRTRSVDSHGHGRTHPFYFIIFKKKINILLNSPGRQRPEQEVLQIRIAARQQLGRAAVEANASLVQDHELARATDAASAGAIRTRPSSPRPGAWRCSRRRGSGA